MIDDHVLGMTVVVPAAAQSSAAVSGCARATSEFLTAPDAVTSTTSSWPSTAVSLMVQSMAASMGKLLVHITSGPEAPTRAALGLWVARAGIDEGHDVNIFFAGDAVQMIRDAVLDSLTGLGTDSLRESFDAIAAGGGRFYVSGMAGKARGVTEDDLKGKPAELATPTRLVQLAFEAHRHFTYQEASAFRVRRQ